MYCLPVTAILLVGIMIMFASGGVFTALIGIATLPQFVGLALLLLVLAWAADHYRNRMR
jgi:hypothetical protein